MVAGRNRNGHIRHHPKVIGKTSFVTIGFRAKQRVLQSGYKLTNLVTIRFREEGMQLTVPVRSDRSIQAVALYFGTDYLPVRAGSKGMPNLPIVSTPR